MEKILTFANHTTSRGARGRQIYLISPDDLPRLPQLLRLYNCIIIVLPRRYRKASRYASTPQGTRCVCVYVKNPAPTFQTLEVSIPLAQRNELASKFICIRSFIPGPTVVDCDADCVRGVLPSGTGLIFNNPS